MANDPLLGERSAASPRRSRLGSALATLSGCALLMLAVMTLTTRHGGPIAALELGEVPNGVAAARAELVAAKQRVQADKARLLRAEGKSRQSLSFSVFPANGPTAEGHRGNTPSVGGPELENPETEFLRTPRVKHYPRFAPNKRHCPGGNCETMDKVGVATDRWPTDVYSGMPNPAWDPEASPKRLRDQNQKMGDFEGVHGDAETYHAPVQWGLTDFRGQGDVHVTDRGVEHLEAAGVEHDRWPFDLYKAMPNPGWDKTEFDQESHEARLPDNTDPYNRILRESEQNRPLYEAGVKINGSPTDVHDRAYNHVDGIYDRMVPVDATPRWRQGGVARQEEPPHFLLRTNADMDGSQPENDFELGVEKEPEDEPKAEGDAEAEGEEQPEEEPEADDWDITHEEHH